MVTWKPTQRVRILLCPGGEKWIFGHLWTGDVEFDRYQVRLDGGDWKDLPKKNTRDGSGPMHGWGPRRFSVVAEPGPHSFYVRVVRRDGSTGPVNFVKFKIE